MGKTGRGKRRRTAPSELRALQHDILESLARGRPLEPVMEELCRRVERMAPGLICTVLSVDPEGRLHPLAAPSLPEHYSAAIDGLAIGPNVGSCGRAAFLGKPVEVTDIASDPLWADFKALALPLGLRACWSSPIHGSAGRVIGTFAFYYRTSRGAAEAERAIVKACVHLCAIALEQEEARRRFHRLAYFDSLTGLPNRVSFQQRANEAIAAAMRENRGLALHLIDLDEFKYVNDTFGHAAGDTLLANVACRFSARLRDAEIVYRLGGDEFAVLQSSAPSTDDVCALAARLVAAADEPFNIAGRAVSIGVSVGSACAPSDGSSLGALMKKADLALYGAKRSGRGRYRLFDREVGEPAPPRRVCERELTGAVEAREFELHYQPIVDLESVELSGVEASVRWRHPRLGLVSPMEFVPLAEETGLIDEIGDWVLEQACACAGAFPAPVRLAVNLSPPRLRKPGFALKVAKTLDASGLAPHRLELEIAGSALLTDDAATLNCLRDLRTLGVSIALDDFGTCCSTLSYLRAFPVDRIKIGRLFVREIGSNAASAAIVRAIIRLARELRIETTAEGVETDAHLRCLRRFRCGEAQGYLIGKPMPLGEIRKVLEGGAGRGAQAKSA